jgi:DUF971 family protein
MNGSLVTIVSLALILISFAARAQNLVSGGQSFYVNEEVLLQGAYEVKLKAIYGGKKVKIEFSDGSTGLYDISTVVKKVEELQGYKVNDEVLYSNSTKAKIIDIYSDGTIEIMFTDESSGFYKLGSTTLTKKVESYEGVISAVYANGYVGFRYEDGSEGFYKASSMLTATLE